VPSTHFAAASCQRVYFLLRPSWHLGFSSSHPRESGR
jgi:hypothetical protein